MIVCAMVLLSLILSGSCVLADGGGMEQGGTGEPPKGLAIQSDAQGAKVVGDMAAEVCDYRKLPAIPATPPSKGKPGNPGYPGDQYWTSNLLRVTLRLSSGNNLFGTFFAEITCPNDSLFCCAPDSPNGCYTTGRFVSDSNSMMNAVIQRLKVPILEYFDFCGADVGKDCAPLTLTLKRFDLFDPINPIVEGTISHVSLNEVEFAVK